MNKGKKKLSHPAFSEQNSTQNESSQRITGKKEIKLIFLTLMYLVVSMKNYEIKRTIRIMMLIMYTKIKLSFTLDMRNFLLRFIFCFQKWFLRTFKAGQFFMQVQHRSENKSNERSDSLTVLVLRMTKRHYFICYTEFYPVARFHQCVLLSFGLTFFGGGNPTICPRDKHILHYIN